MLPCIKSAKDTYVFPAQGCLAVLTVDICYSMQACKQNPLLCRATPNVHPEEEDNRRGETEGQEGEITIVQLAPASQLRVMYDVLRVSQCFAPTRILIGHMPACMDTKVAKLHI